MFIVSKRNLIIPGGKGREDVSIAKDFVGEIPDWVGGTAYFQALVKDEKIVLSEGGKTKKDKKPSKKENIPLVKSPEEPPLEPREEGTLDGD